MELGWREKSSLVPRIAGRSDVIALPAERTATNHNQPISFSVWLFDLVRTMRSIYLLSRSLLASVCHVPIIVIIISLSPFFFINIITENRQHQLVTRQINH